MKSYTVVNASTRTAIETYQYKVWAENHIRLIGGAIIQSTYYAKNVLQVLEIDHWTRVFENRPGKYVPKKEALANKAVETLADIKARVNSENDNG